MSRITVSDHAVLRWLERVEGVNIAAIRRRIRRAASRGAGTGCSAVLLDGVQFHLAEAGAVLVVTTVFSERPRPHLAEPRGAFDEDGDE